jgi:type VI secretion system protein ImpL
MTRKIDMTRFSMPGIVALMAATVAVLIVIAGGLWWLWAGKPAIDRAAWQDLILKGVLCWIVLCATALLSWHRVQSGIRKLVLSTRPVPALFSTESTKDNEPDLIQDLRDRHGPLWRYKIRFLLVMGEPAQVEAVAPGLQQKQWLEARRTVLLWGGSLLAPQTEPVPLWHKVTRWKPLDEVVWALDVAQSKDAPAMGKSIRNLRRLAREQRWQMKLHVWQVCQSDWSQDDRPSQQVGCVLPSRMNGQALQAIFERYIPTLCEMGLGQVNEKRGHDFLYRLSRELKEEIIPRWNHVLKPLFSELARDVRLRGLWFSLPVPKSKAPSDDINDRFWSIDPVWDGVLGDRSASRRIGWAPMRIAQTATLTVLALSLVGLLVSGYSNSTQITQVQQALFAVQSSEDPDRQLLALSEWVRELGRLDQRERDGGPWYQRFGLGQNRTLLDTLWPQYVEANNRLMRDRAADNLQRQLQAWVDLPAGSAEQNASASVAYDQLKAWLMMVRPEQAEPVFLARVLGESEPSRDGVSPGVWREVSPLLWQFYAEQLRRHPTWRIGTDPQRVTQVRQRLLGLLAQRNGEDALYRQALESVGQQHPALRLRDMLGEVAPWPLMSGEGSVAGVFTREAWEGQIRGAIDEIAKTRREEIDWVLSDNHTGVAAELKPDALKARLTERYFRDYAAAWLGFLNSVRWQKADSLSQVIDQLTLISDARESPLIALMNTLAWQGQAGQRTAAAIALDTSLKNATLKNTAPLDNIPALDTALPGPLDATFGPLLTLIGKDPQVRTEDQRPNLHGFLTQVTRVRLKLQQISSAPDPQGMTQALAQTVFQDKSIDLTDAQAYGGLIAASLGGPLRGVGQALFVQPLEQAWQKVLQPAASSLNRQWQQSIVEHWDEAFNGRYPFAATGSDASLPMLGQMIRADSGRIEQFLQRELGGVLRKDGNRWVADPRHKQALRINPAFLAAINQLSHLADVLYTDGGMGLAFELRGKAVRDVVQTTFMLNGARHEYFNQKESWQRFAWPGSTDYPGARLTWTSVHTGARLYGDFEGTWGLIRLLEKARITPLDDGDSRYRVVVEAPDGLNLLWHLRTELGAGPMSLLTLRDFTLPKQIFLVSAR